LKRRHIINVLQTPYENFTSVKNYKHGDGPKLFGSCPAMEKYTNGRYEPMYHSFLNYFIIPAIVYVNFKRLKESTYRKFIKFSPEFLPLKTIVSSLFHDARDQSSCLLTRLCIFHAHNLR